MIIGFTGTQYGMTVEQQNRILQFLVRYDNKIQEFHHGDCIGADEEAFRLFIDHGGITTVSHPPVVRTKRAFTASHEELPPRPYIARNHDIVDAADIVLATPKSMKEELRSGTWATIRYARRQKKTLYIIYPDGKMVVEAE